uniref:NADH-ubiquinone oxidoreductase chain 2 n=1 Tax=Cucujoidea sp. 14 KM-2017 TaxID=2219350 RepID=A0A346RFJ7_9CUCU|nr:NADH dehydrogenase subunit 2 [Cucujoidea sp. 14 KM-2017]
MLFVNTLILGTLISISAYSWFSMWIGLEINLLSFIPLINKSSNNYSSEASIKYFIIQALSSIFILFSIILILSVNNNFNFSINILTLILNSALLTKMGAAPFHFWFVEIIEGMNWLNSLILLTWQKIAPMILIMYNVNYFLYPFMFFIIMSCMIVSGIMGWNQISLRKILTYSSINHMGWMLSLILFNQSLWMFYFLIYSFISLSIIFIFKKMKINLIQQLFNIMSNNSSLKLFFIINFFSLGGLPPFLGFFPKWLSIEILIKSEFYLLALFMVIMTLLTMYFYLRLMISSLTFNNSNKINFNFKNLNLYFIYLNYFMNFSGLIFISILWNF